VSAPWGQGQRWSSKRRFILFIWRGWLLEKILLYLLSDATSAQICATAFSVSSGRPLRNARTRTSNLLSGMLRSNVWISIWKVCYRLFKVFQYQAYRTFLKSRIAFICRVSISDCTQVLFRRRYLQYSPKELTRGWPRVWNVDVYTAQRLCLTFRNMAFLYSDELSSPLNHQASGSSFVGCPRLLIQYVRSYPSCITTGKYRQWAPLFVLVITCYWDEMGGASYLWGD
jgi:hypothetical protein